MILLVILSAIIGGFLAGVSYISFICIDQISLKLFIVLNLGACAATALCVAYKLLGVN